jgi:hypothetical protein
MRRGFALLVGLLVALSGVPALGRDLEAAVVAESSAGRSPAAEPTESQPDGRPDGFSGSLSLAASLPSDPFGAPGPALSSGGSGAWAWIFGSGPVGAVVGEVSEAAARLLALRRWVAGLFFYPAVAGITVSIDPGEVTTLTSGLGSVSDVVVVDGYGYVAEATAIWQVDLDTGDEVLLAGNSSTAGCVDDSDPGVVRFNGVTAVTTDGSSLFVLDDCPSGFDVPNAIREVDLSSGATSTVVSLTKTLTDIVYAGDGYLYAVEDPRKIWQVDPSDGSYSLFVEHPYEDETLGPTGDLTAITADSDYLYVVAEGFLSSQPDHINRVALSDASIGRVAEAHLIGRSLESAGDFLYGTGDFSFYVRDLRLNRYAKADGSWATVAGSGGWRWRPGSGGSGGSPPMESRSGSPTAGATRLCAGWWTPRRWTVSSSPKSRRRWRSTRGG